MFLPLLLLVASESPHLKSQERENGYIESENYAHYLPQYQGCGPQRIHSRAISQLYLLVKDIHNSWLYCFTNPLELGTRVSLSQMRK